MLFFVVLAFGCGDSDGGGDNAGNGGGGGAGGASDNVTGGTKADPPASGKDAGPDPDEDSGAPSAGDVDASADASDSVPPPPECDEGDMPCGQECIPEIPPTLGWIHLRILSRSCALSASCHTGAAPKEGFDMSTVESTLEAVGRASAQMPTRSIIEAGKPEDSYILNKLRGMGIADKSSTGVAATQMPPPPSVPLCDAKIALIEEWIANGAQND